MKTLTLVAANLVLFCTLFFLPHAALAGGPDLMQRLDDQVVDALGKADPLSRLTVGDCLKMQTAYDWSLCKEFDDLPIALADNAAVRKRQELAAKGIVLAPTFGQWRNLTTYANSVKIVNPESPPTNWPETINHALEFFRDQMVDAEVREMIESKGGRGDIIRFYTIINDSDKEIEEAAKDRVREQMREAGVAAVPTKEEYKLISDWHSGEKKKRDVQRVLDHFVARCRAKHREFRKMRASSESKDSGKDNESDNNNNDNDKAKDKGKEKE